MNQTPRKTSRAIDLALLVLTAGALRLFGLGRLGLYGDEELTALAIQAILQDGWPHMPSGMPYWRAMPFSYAGAAIAAVFGLSEASLRLLPAVVGTLTPAALYVLAARVSGSRRVALVSGLLLAFSGWHVDMSREGRMYAVFLAALIPNMTLFVAGFVRGSRKAVVATLCLAPLTLLLHELSIAMLLFWGVALLLGWRRLSQRPTLIAALAAGGVFWVAALKLSKGFVPRALPADLSAGARSLTDRLLDLFYLDFRPRWALLERIGETPGMALLIAGTALLGIWAVVRAARTADVRGWGYLLLAIIGLVAAAFELFGVVAAGVLLTGLLFAGRITHVCADYPRLSLIWVAAILGLGLEWTALGMTGPAFAGSSAAGRLVETARDLVGFPSPHLRVFFEVFPVMTLVVVAGTVAWIVNGGPDDRKGYLRRCLFLWLWLPLIGLGFAREWIALRYALPLYPFFLLVWAWTLVASVDGLSSFAAAVPRLAPWARRLRWAPPLLVAACLVAPLLNESHGLGPASFWSRLDYGQPTDVVLHGFPFHPDHAGAGDFVRRRMRPDDRIIAMDAQQQQYYSGRVDYRLVRLSERKTFGTYVDGVLRDIYTHAAVLETLPELETVLEARGETRIWLITSGEMVGDKAEVIPAGVPQRLADWDHHRVHTGRDGVTAVYLFE